MKNLRQPARNGAIVWIRGHDVAHVFPPTLAHFGRGDRVPTRFVFDFDIAEKLVGRGIVKNRVIVRTVGSKHRRKIVPNGLMTAGVFGFAAGVNLQDEGFANHRVEGAKPKLQAGAKV